MRKSAGLLFAVLIVVGGYFFLQNFEIDGLDHIKIRPRGDQSGQHVSLLPEAIPPLDRTNETVRIASFNIQVFGQSKLRKPQVMDILSRVVRRYDLVAIQEIRAKSQDIIPQFVEMINSNGRQYDYVIGERLGRSSSKEQYAFIFDSASIEVDRNQMYTIADPDDLLHREPLVAWFRVRGPPPEQAFTFSLVNIHTDPDETDQELNALDDVYRAVRDDGRAEDDVIILGDLNVDDRDLGQLGEISGINWVISGTPTNTRGTKQYDNIVYHTSATTEFTGNGGVFDFTHEYSLDSESALEVSDHMPIWAEFSIYEGGQLGRVATLPADRPGPPRANIGGAAIRK